MKKKTKARIAELESDLGVMERRCARYEKQIEDVRKALGIPTPSLSTSSSTLFSTPPNIYWTNVKPVDLHAVEEA